MPITRTTSALLALPRPVKRALAVGIDAALCVVTVWVAFGLRLDQWDFLTGKQWFPVAVSLAVALPLFVSFGLYRAIFRYSGWEAIATLVRAMFIYSLVFSGFFTFYGVAEIPRTVGIIQPVLMLVGVGASRLLASYWLGGLYKGMLRRQALPRVLIYGAGAAGRQLAAALSTSRDMTIVGFLDDDATLQGNTINGLPVFAFSDLARAITKFGATEVLLAIPSASRQRRNQILRTLQPYAVRVRTVSPFVSHQDGAVHESDIRELEIEDLLGRDPVSPNAILLNKNIRGKVVLVTGAGGSIGSELCRQIAKVSPKILLLIEVSEFALYSVHQELDNFLRSGSGSATRVIPLLASVRDRKRMSEIMATWRPDTVYHAAAYKHVPLVEHNPAEGIHNNVFGTLHTAEAALQNGVSNFVLISTDKAVRPTNIMGASKRLAELVLQALASGTTDLSGTTRFSMVRFGNVLGSSGSVVPLFRRQIQDGGPITLTHADITRYFMTIPEAAQLVIQASAMASGGDVFVLDMGEPVRIIDLAHRMVELSGRKVRTAENSDGDIEIQITGLRPGEKLFEELLIGDNPEPTQHARIMKAHEECLTWSELQVKLSELERALVKNEVSSMKLILGKLVSGYQPHDDVVDWIHLERREERDDLGVGKVGQTS